MRRHRPRKLEVLEVLEVLERAHQDTVRREGEEADGFGARISAVARDRQMAGKHRLIVARARLTRTRRHRSRSSRSTEAPGRPDCGVAFL